MLRFVLKKASHLGFTMVELMVVVSIISILAAVLFASFDEGRKQSRDKVRQAELKELQLAIELYKAQNGQYPAKGCGITAIQWTGPGSFAASPWGLTCEPYIDGLVPNFTASLPRDPNQEPDDGKGYVYQTNADRSSYKVLVHGSVESQMVTSYENEFARCPYDCSMSYCSATPQNDVYAVYSVGAECW
jgi:prepilin-type N-terminal cleavage/methylation domain-containing protein